MAAINQFISHLSYMCSTNAFELPYIHTQCTQLTVFASLGSEKSQANPHTAFPEPRKKLSYEMPSVTHWVPMCREIGRNIQCIYTSMVKG